LQRTRRDLVTFLHPFSLPGIQEEQRPGTYTVEAIEELIDAPTLVAYRRVSTTIVLPSPRYGYAAKQVVAIDPCDLEAAKKKDAETASDAGRLDEQIPVMAKREAQGLL
jgi:hypothetical protein